nr:immunoglobulin heavy chain junction region [Mus musculus]
CARSGRFDYW